MSLIIFIAAAVRANNAINFCITEKLGKKIFISVSFRTNYYMG